MGVWFYVLEKCCFVIIRKTTYCNPVTSCFFHSFFHFFFPFFIFSHHLLQNTVAGILSKLWINDHLRQGSPNHYTKGLHQTLPIQSADLRPTDWSNCVRLIWLEEKPAAPMAICGMVWGPLVEDIEVKLKTLAI